MPYSAFAQAIGSFLNTYKASASGVTQEGAITYQFERYQFWNEDFRVHVIVESKLEDLDLALQKAVESDNFELAARLRDIIAARNDTGNKTPGADGASEGGDEPI